MTTSTPTINIIPDDYQGNPRDALGYAWADLDARIPGDTLAETAMSGVIWPEVGDGLWWTNQRGGKLRGVCETHCDMDQAAWIGVRLENGNFRWATPDECSPRDLSNNCLGSGGMKTAYTRGPWGACCAGIGTHNERLVKVVKTGLVGWGDAIADSRLIAAAPDLLDALTDLVGGCGKEGNLFSGAATAKARYAIEKATSKATGSVE